MANFFKNRSFGFLIFFSTLLTVVLTILIGSVFVVGGYWRYFVSGPSEVMAKISPDGQYKAFVLNAPSIDGPNQSINIETTDQKYLLKIANLEEDVDFIKDIMWSSGNDAVVFWSKDYITLVRIEDYQIWRIFLGKPWIRENSNHRSTFKVQESREVEWVKIEEGVLKYKFRNGIEKEINYTENLI